MSETWHTHIHPRYRTNHNIIIVGNCCKFIGVRSVAACLGKASEDGNEKSMDASMYFWANMDSKVNKVGT